MTAKVSCRGRPPCTPPPWPRITGQEDAGRAVGQEDGHRVVVGLREKFAGGRCYDVGSHAAREERSATCLGCKSLLVYLP